MLGAMQFGRVRRYLNPCESSYRMLTKERFYPTLNREADGSPKSAPIAPFLEFVAESVFRTRYRCEASLAGDSRRNTRVSNRSRLDFCTGRIDLHVDQERERRSLIKSRYERRIYAQNVSTGPRVYDGHTHAQCLEDLRVLGTVSTEIASEFNPPHSVSVITTWSFGRSEHTHINTLL